MMGSVRMFWFLLFCSSFIFIQVSEAKQHGKSHSSAIVVGTVYCDTCFQQDFSETKHFISGASVAVVCENGSSRSRFYRKVKTNEQGEFKVHLPFAVSKHVKQIKRCSVTLISSSEPYCAVASSATSSSLHLKSRKAGSHIFSAGFFTFKPLKEPELCNQKPSIQNSNEFKSSKTFLVPTIPNVPTLTPLPSLPNIPPIPNLPFLAPTTITNTSPINLPAGIPLPPISNVPNSKFSQETAVSNEFSSSKTFRFPPSMPNLPFFTPMPPLPNLPPLPNFPSLPPMTPTPTPSMPTVPAVTPPIPLTPSVPNSKPLPALEQLNQPIQPKQSEASQETPVSDEKTVNPTTFFPPIIPPILPQPPPTFGGIPLPPNPLQPPPLLPNPLQPPSTGFPPLLPTPILPPIPVLTPPPPPPIFPFPFPPLPFPPLPGFPGIPPASTSKKTSP